MTEEEAKKEIIDMANTLQLIPNTPKGKAVLMAIKALGQESCEDCVSRIEALNSLDKVENKDSWYRLTDVMKMIRNLPPVTPHPKTGHWNSWFTEIKGNNTFNCMECGSTFIVEQGAHNMNYCPNCGCRMVETQENEVTYADSH